MAEYTVKEKMEHAIAEAAASFMTNEYVVKGAQLKCTLGSAPSLLNLPLCHGFYATGHPIIHSMDNKPMVNILPFGTCPVLGGPCVPAPVGPWLNTHEKTMIADAAPGGPLYPAVTMKSFLVCALGGLIEPKKSGQEYKAPGAATTLEGAGSVDSSDYAKAPANTGAFQHGLLLIPKMFAAPKVAQQTAELLNTLIDGVSSSDMGKRLILDSQNQVRENQDQDIWFIGYEDWTISQGFNGDNKHCGVDLYSADGTIKALYSGVVGAVKFDVPDDSGTGNGNYICIKHEIDGTTFYTAYCHMKNSTAKVSVGQEVSSGTELGTIGNTGNSGGIHLHMGCYIITNGAETWSAPGYAGIYPYTFKDEEENGRYITVTDEWGRTIRCFDFREVISTNGQIIIENYQ